MPPERVYLSEQDNIVRYVKPSSIHKGKVNGNEFKLRPNETGISANWMEFFRGTKEFQIKEIKSLARIKLNKNGKYAELNVGSVCKVELEKLQSLKVRKSPLKKDRVFKEDGSHCEIVVQALENLNMIIVGEIIAKCISTLHPIPK